MKYVVFLTIKNVKMYCIFAFFSMRQKSEKKIEFLLGDLNSLCYTNKVCKLWR